MPEPYITHHHKISRWPFGINHWMKADIKPKNKVRPILTVSCLNHIFLKLLWFLNSKNIATHFIMWHHIYMLIICKMMNNCLCWLFLFGVDIIRDYLPQVIELPFCAGIILGRCIIYSTIWKKLSFGVIFIVSSVNAYSEWIRCTETLITYHMYLFWHERVWRHQLRHRYR